MFELIAPSKTRVTVGSQRLADLLIKQGYKRASKSQQNSAAKPEPATETEAKTEATDSAEQTAPEPVEAEAAEQAEPAETAPAKPVGKHGK